jgi:predicted GNAT family acetyltransferase
VTALRTATVRPLALADATALRGLIDAEPYVNATVAARLAAGPVGSRDLIGVGAPLTAACFCGGTLLPIGGTAAEWTALAGYLRARPRPCSSIVGPAETLAGLWPELEPTWGPAREIRAVQPLLVLDRPSTIAPDPRVRPAVRDDLEHYLPAAAAMFTEELGIAPLRGARAHAFRTRLAELIASRRALVRTDRHGNVVFKAEIAAVSRHTAQVQGVWVHPDRRGQGLGTAAMAAVAEYALRLAPAVSLYVNDFNRPARRVYERLGMRRVGTVSTVLF